MDKLTQDQVNEAMNKTYGNRAAFAAACQKIWFRCCRICCTHEQC